MDSISKENEFTRIKSQDGHLVCATKSKFLKFGYYYYYSNLIFSSTPVEMAVPVNEIKKMRIQSMGIVSILFFIFSAMAFGFGFLNGKDKFTGETIPAPGSQIATGAIIAIILLALGILYLKSKTGRLKVLHTYHKGSATVLYSSLDRNELEELRKKIDSREFKY